jgi:hypothetical protein
MIIVQETSYRIPAILLVAITLAILVGINISRGQSLSRALRRCVYAVSAVVLLTACFFIVVSTRSALEFFLRDARWRWVRMVEPNILDRHVRAARRNRNILLPVTNEGLMITVEEPTDLHVELDSSGYMSIHNCLLSQSRFASLLSQRVEKCGAFRIFIWCDANTPLESSTDLIRILLDSGCTQLYRVVSSPPTSDGEIDHRAVPWDEYSGNKDEKREHIGAHYFAGREKCDRTR